MDFDSFKYSMGDIGIIVGNAFGLLHGVRLDEDQTSGFIRKGSGTDQSALSVKGPAQTNRPCFCKRSRYSRWAGLWCGRLLCPSGPSHPMITYVMDSAFPLWIVKGDNRLRAVAVHVVLSGRACRPVYPSSMSCHHSMVSSPSLQQRYTTRPSRRYGKSHKPISRSLTTTPISWMPLRFS